MKVFSVIQLLRTIVVHYSYGHEIHISIGKSRKNSCPLCQAEGIAEEIRSPDFETSETSESHSDSVNGIATESNAPTAAV